ncbi:MAG: glycosyltransferase family 4 protein [bacterium]|nr:glycosyltransferase family 4 protein [bacterium]
MGYKKRIGISNPPEAERASYKVILVTPDFPPENGGIQNVLYGIAKSLGIDVIAPNSPGTREFDRKQSFRTYRVPYVKGNKKLSLPFIIVKTILLKPDFLICGHILTAIVGVLALKPYIVYTYGMEVTTFRYRLLMRWLMMKAYRVVTISEFTKEYLLKLGVPLSKIVKIYPVVDMRVFNLGVDETPVVKKYNLYNKSQDGGMSNKSIILTVGRMSKDERYKGHDIMIKILPEIIKKVPDVVWVVVGTGDDYERFREDINNLKLSEYVVFTGKVSQRELAGLYKAANVFVMPSIEKPVLEGVKGEGFGIVYIEANACGTPVVAYKTGGVSEAIIDGVTGILVEQGNSEKLTESIIKLLLDKKFSKKLGLQGNQRVSKELNIELLRERFEGLIKL